MRKFLQKKTLVLSIVLFFSFCVHLSAQISVIGFVNAEKTGKGLPNAILEVKNLNMTVLADSKGYYEFQVPNTKDSLRLIVSANYVGYINLVKSITVNSKNNNDNVIVDFNLLEDIYEIENVIISANKVEEEMQDVPVSASGISASNMKNRTVSSTTEALESIPNLLTDSYLPNQPTFSLRGLASNFDNNGIENSVGLYIDDVYYSRSFSFNSTLMDIERVEVLRGPQGTLFGKNTIGGVIHLISEKPKMGNSAAVELTMGNYMYYQTRAKANVMLIKDKLALRVAGAYKHKDGWMLEENPNLQDKNGISFFGGRATLLYRPNEKLEISLKGNYGKDNKAEFTTDYITSSFGHRLPVDEVYHDPLDRKSFRNEDGVYFNRTSGGATGRIDYKLDDTHTLTSITAYNSSSSSFLKDFDVSPIDATTFTKDSELGTFTQELRITTPRENKKLFYVGGLYFIDETIKSRDSIALHEAFGGVWLQQFGMPAGEIPGYFEYVSPQSEIAARSIAAYVSGSYELVEQVRVNAGLRFTNEVKELSFSQDIGRDFNLISFAVSQVGSREEPLIRTETDNVISYNVGLDFKTTDKILLFINASRGFKGAGFNTEFAPDSLGGTLVFRPEFINSYELGIKMKQSRRFRWNTTFFVTDYKDKQETAPGGSAYRVANAESAQGIGLESEFSTFFTKAFRLDASFGVSRLRYFSFPFSDRNGFPINLSGNRLYKAPEFTFQASPAYIVDIGSELRMRLQLDYRYIGKTYNDIYNTESLARQATGILNGRIAFSILNDKYSLAIWSKNITDETYFQHAWEFNFGSHVALNPPRTIGVEIRANFY